MTPTALAVSLTLVLALVLGASIDTNGQPMTAKAAAVNYNKQHQQPSEAKGAVFKRSFVGLGCLGVYDKSKFARLDRICEDCYQLYREPDIHTACRIDCFRNSVFTGCVDALLLSSDKDKFKEMVEELYGK